MAREADMTRDGVRHGGEEARNGAGAALLWFHHDLKDFLAPVNRTRECIPVDAGRRAAVKDAIEALGPPHTEVGSILVNGHARGFGHLLRGGELVAVHPVERPRVVLRPTFLRPEPLRELRFAVDANVGKLARRMRLLGLDTLYDRSLGDAELAAMSGERVIVTKDRGVLKRSQVTYGHLVRNEDPGEQILELTDCRT